MWLTKLANVPAKISKPKYPNWKEGRQERPGKTGKPCGLLGHLRCGLYGTRAFDQVSLHRHRSLRLHLLWPGGPHHDCHWLSLCIFCILFTNAYCACFAFAQFGGFWSMYFKECYIRGSNLRDSAAFRLQYSLLRRSEMANFEFPTSQSGESSCTRFPSRLGCRWGPGQKLQL